MALAEVSVTTTPTASSPSPSSMAPRMDRRTFTVPFGKLEGSFPIYCAQISPFLKYHAHLWLLEEDRGKQGKDHWTPGEPVHELCKERLKGSESLSLKERKLKDDLDIRHEKTSLKLFSMAGEGQMRGKGFKLTGEIAISHKGHVQTLRILLIWYLGEV